MAIPSLRYDIEFQFLLGASSGIGKTTAILFAELGAKLVLTGRNEDELLKTKSECQERNKTIAEVSVDHGWNCF